MNGMFLLLALAMCLAALGCLLYPLWRSPPGGDDLTARQVSLRVHRDRLRELSRDLALGTLTRERHDAAVADLERELLDSGCLDPSAESPLPGPGRGVALVAVISLVAVPFMAAGLYASVGHAEQVFATHPPPARDAAPLAPADLDAQFRALAGEMQMRLARDPEDLSGWILLGRTLSHLDRHRDAARAFREALALLPPGSREAGLVRDHLTEAERHAGR
ncbi:c-type cytochrome biogenesis protein CcmI [Halomonas sp. C05BenzN]|uniref:c-type cytochrome biogenesis protein CcmI n=1 Tax=Halomonas sp. C05BenzN TaxID=3411041 RepID=UPI003B93042B